MTAGGAVWIDFGAAPLRIAGKEATIALFVLTPPCSGAIFAPPGRKRRRMD